MDLGSVVLSYLSKYSLLNWFGTIAEITAVYAHLLLTPIYNQSLIDIELVYLSLFDIYFGINLLPTISNMEGGDDRLLLTAQEIDWGYLQGFTGQTGPVEIGLI